MLVAATINSRRCDSESCGNIGLIPWNWNVGLRYFLLDKFLYIFENSCQILNKYRAWENIGGGKDWRIVNHSSIFFANYFCHPLALEPC